MASGAASDLLRIARALTLVMREQARILSDRRECMDMVSRIVVQPCIRKRSAAPKTSTDGVPPAAAPPTTTATPPSTEGKSGNSGAQQHSQAQGVTAPFPGEKKNGQGVFSKSSVDVLSSATTDVSDNNTQHEYLKATATGNASPSPSEPILNQIPISQMRERRVPETPLARVLAFSTLGAGLAMGAAAESARRLFQSPSADSTAEASGIYSSFVSDANAQRLADSLSRMRGAALKLGQMLSIQDEDVVPPIVSQALERVRQAADVMPQRQLEGVLGRELGADWREKVVEFDNVPLAAASIGQVHRGVIEDENGVKQDVVFKVQYPGVARSIRSDLANLKRLVTVGNVIPDSFYLNEALKAAEEELTLECDYSYEARMQREYRELVLQSERLNGRFYVPKVFEGLSTKEVLVSEFVQGVPIDQVASMSAEVRDRVANNMLELCLTELFEFQLQQSDPNFANYLYNAADNRIHLVDFGACRVYSRSFLRSYLQLILACADQRTDAIIEHSISLGFLTGSESKDMLRAHTQASIAVGEPFQERYNDSEAGYDFIECDIAGRTARFGKTMLEQRLTPPPKEAYALHRRLSGAFLMSRKLRARVQARRLLMECVERVRGELLE